VPPTSSRWLSTHQCYSHRVGGTVCSSIRSAVTNKQIRLHGAVHSTGTDERETDSRSVLIKSFHVGEIHINLRFLTSTFSCNLATLIA